MKFTQHYSSSTGSLYTVENHARERLMIECGVSWPKIRKALEGDMSVSGCLCSHSHSDHSMSIKDVMKAGIDVYSSQETFDVLGVGGSRRAKPLKIGRWYDIDKFKVMAFDVNHDAPGALGFIIYDATQSMFFMTDSRSLDYTFSTPFDIVALECSYNEEYLQKRVKDGSIHETVAKRLLTSHMKEAECLRTLRNFLNLDRCEQIHLLHLSHDNIHKKRLKAEFEKALMVEVKII